MRAGLQLLNERCTSLLRVPHLLNDLYCVEWDVKLYYTYHTIPKRAYDCVGILYNFVVLLHNICVLPWPYVIHFLLLSHDVAYLC